MNLSRSSDQVLAMHNRLKLLYSEAGTIPATPSSMVPTMMKDMGIVMEELQVALEEISQQNKALAEALENTALERKRYHDLFQFATEAYFVTDLDGIIQNSNRMAAQLLDMPTQFLIGKPLSRYVSENDRPAFQAELARPQPTPMPNRSTFGNFRRTTTRNSVVSLTTTVKRTNWATCRRRHLPQYSVYS